MITSPTPKAASVGAARPQRAVPRTITGKCHRYNEYEMSPT